MNQNGPDDQLYGMWLNGDTLRVTLFAFVGYGQTLPASSLKASLDNDMISLHFALGYDPSVDTSHGIPLCEHSMKLTFVFHHIAHKPYRVKVAFAYTFPDRHGTMSWPVRTLPIKSLVKNTDGINRTAVGMKSPYGCDP